VSTTRNDGPARAVAAALLTGLRRTVTTTAAVCLLPVAAAALPAVCVLTAPVSLVLRGRWRSVRICAFALLYLVVDLCGLVAAGAVWLRYAPGTRDASARRTAATYTLLDRLLRVLRRAATPVFGLTLRVTPAIPRATPGAPLIVLARHAGPGDSFLLLHLLLAEAGLLPHTVLRRALRFDPCLDVIMGRLPHCFLPPRRGRTAPDAVGELSGRLRGGDALVLFPEGGNYTERRHRRAVASLRRHGRPRTAARAARMRHVLPPRTAGTLAALAAAPGADVVFVAHTGLDAIDSVRTAWAGIPLRSPVRAHWWRVPASGIPDGDGAREQWLLTQWQRVDQWIAGR
jgi:1-acyl-sn-glycerol-3-phosphate acyltransferase